MPQKPSESSPSAVPAIFTLILIAVLFFLAFDQLEPPAFAPATAPLAEFSSARALAQLKVFAQKPHPTGSAENARVRGYLVNQLSSLGLDPRVETATAVQSLTKWRGSPSAATVNNIVARLKGTANTKAVMLSAHYDSVPSGPGASDDGAGVAILLETARALEAGPPPKNDVVFLFTDGEELGMMGAEAFVRENAWIKNVGVELNFDQRGACGASVMFETSDQNGWLISQFAKAAPHPVAMSFMYDAYKRMPNDTDMSIFKDAGLAGLNFGYVGCWPCYHTMEDSVENLDARSLQQEGSQALALARQFGNEPLWKVSGPDAVYFTIHGATFYYSQAWVIPLTVVVICLFAAVVVLGLRKRQLTWRGMAWGFFGWLGGTLVAAVISEFAWSILRRTSLVSALPYGRAYNGNLYALGFIALTVAILSGLYVRLQKRTRITDLAIGALAWWGFLAILCGFIAPGSNYLFALPLLFSLIELGYAFLHRDPESETEGFLIWTLPAIVGILLFGGIPYALVTLLSSTSPALLAAVVALLLGFLAPQIHVLTARNGWWLPGAAALIALALLASAMAASGYGARHPRADSVSYYLNADTNQGFWISTDPRPDAWTSQFFGGPIEKGNLGEILPWKRPILKADAPVAGLKLAAIAPMDDVTLGDERILRLWIESPPEARNAWVSVEGAKVLEAKVNGQPLAAPSPGARSAAWSLAYSGLPQNGIILTMTLPASQTPVIKLVEQVDGLPEIPGRTFRPRPPGIMPELWPPLDSSTLVSRTFRFEAKP